MNRFISFLALLLPALALAEDCANNPQELGARYTVQQQTKLNFANPAPQERQLSLWRHQGLVAHVHESDGLADIWTKQPNGWLRPVRYFDEAKRGIEYMATEVNGGKGEKDWSLRYQLISDRMMNALVKVDETGDGCDRLVSYEGTIGKARITLSWMPHYQLVNFYEESRPDRMIRWKLEGIIVDPALVAAPFESRKPYQTTDYADIGDSENDPFLRTLIHQGFVAHGASGFYDASGKEMSSGYGHVH